MLFLISIRCLFLYFISKHLTFTVLDQEKNREDDLTNDIGHSSNSSSSNNNLKIKQEEIDADSDLDASTNFSNASRSGSSWYSCDGQI